MITPDRIDFEIMGLLQNDGRLANKQLARQIGLAPSSCLTRVRRLIDTGAIRGFHADINPSALGIGLQALLAVRLERHHREDVDSFITYATTLPEVVSVMHIAGPTDVLVHVAVRDGNHLRDLAMDAFTTRPEVARFETSLLYNHQTKAMVSLHNQAD
ncbi:MAG: Lrp/AsnC family transcriptional regulator [Ilumatobacteraceae bacterium]